MRTSHVSRRRLKSYILRSRDLIKEYMQLHWEHSYVKPPPPSPAHRFLTVSAWWWSIQRLSVRFGITALICVQAAAVFPPLCLYHLCKSRHSEKRKEHSSIIMKIVLSLWTPWKGPRDPQGSKVYTLGTAALGCLAPCLVHGSYFNTWLLNKCWTEAWI